jgi:ATP-binding cassette, subfamily B, bacterial
VLLGTRVMKMLVAGLFAVTLAAAVLDTILPLLLGHIIDGLGRVLTDARPVEAAVAAYVAVALLSTFAALGETFLAVLVARRCVTAITGKLFTALQRAPLDQVASFPAGEIVNRTSGDPELLAEQLIATAIPLAASVLGFTAALVAGFVLEWRIALALLAVVPVIALTARPSTAELPELRAEISRAKDEREAILAERLSAAGMLRAKIFRSYASDRDDLERTLDHSTSATVRLAVRFARSSALFGMGMNVVGPSAVLLVGTLLLAHGRTTGGVLVAFMMLQSRILGPAGALTMSWLRVHSIRGIIDRLADLLSIRPEREDLRVPPSRAALTLRGVRVTRGESTVVDALTLSVDYGQLTVVTGRSGCGKSTLGLACARLVDIDFGTICLGDEIVSLDEWRRSVCFIPQFDTIATGSVRENLLIARPDATDADLWNALAVVELDDDVRERRQALDADAGVIGGRLSGGQRQRLALARAVLTGACVLILDECTSGLDEEMETRILRRLRSPQRAIVAISHRSSVERIADQIVDLSTQRGLVRAS